ncbi:hydroxyproline-rich glycoprotein family protein [Tanacetum coccineum]
MPRHMRPMSKYFSRKPQSVKREGRQQTINRVCKKELRNNACKEMAKWFYDAGLPFNAATYDSFHITMEAVLRIIDGDIKPAMGYIYEAVDRLKETISDSFANKKVHYRKAFEIIERRLVPNLRIQDAIADQLDLYQKEVRMLGDPMEIRHRSTKAPTDLWVAYRSSSLNIQKFAIRVLSLTCSATGYCRCKRIDTADPILLKDIDESNECLMGHMDGEEEPATNFVYADDDLTWAGVDIASGKGAARTSIPGSKAYGLVDEDYEEDIGIFEDGGVNEELGIDVDDDKDDENDF